MIILYTDDKVLMSNTKEDLQYQFDCLLRYCQEWKLEVNIDKTKIMVFSKGRLSNNCHFLYNAKELEIVKDAYKN
jgi:hypothetical protein